MTGCPKANGQYQATEPRILPKCVGKAWVNVGTTRPRCNYSGQNMLLTSTFGCARRDLTPLLGRIHIAASHEGGFDTRWRATQPAIDGACDAADCSAGAHERFRVLPCVRSGDRSYLCQVIVPN